MGALDNIIGQASSLFGGGGSGASGLLGQFLKVMSFTIYGIFIFFLGWGAMVFLKYNKVALVKKITADGKIVRVYKENAMEYYDKNLGMLAWKLFQSRRIVPKPKLKFITLYGKKEACEFWEDSSRDLHNIKVEKEGLDKNDVKLFDKVRNFFKPRKMIVPYDLGLKPVENACIDEKVVINPVPEDRKALHLAQNKKIAEKARMTADWWAKYGHIVVPVIAYVSLFIAIFFISKHIGLGLKEVASSLGQVATACKP